MVTTFTSELELAEAAVTELQNRPWIRGQTYDAETGGVCAMGAAMGAALRIGGHVVHLIDKLDEQARRTEPRCHSITAYNDLWAESKEDVADIFRAVIKSEIAKEEQA